MRTENYSVSPKPLVRGLVAGALGLAALVAADAALSLPAQAAPASAAPTAAMEGEFAGEAKCSLCHKELYEAFANTAHDAMEASGHRCEDCHGPGADHVGTAGSKGKIRSFKTAAPEVIVDACLACHGSDATPHVRDFRGGPWQRRGLTCVTCHAVHVERTPRGDTEATVPPALSTATCLTCHADPSYSRDFGHRVLEGESPACTSCHDGGQRHVEERGAPGTVGSPVLLSLEDEQASCLRCHGGFEEVIHFPNQPEPTRCTSCHELHSLEARLHGDTERTGDGESAGDTVVAPEEHVPGPSFLRGSLRIGARWVGGEGGLYDQEIALDDGLRLFHFDVEAGMDEGGPDETVASLRLDGLGDSYESLGLDAHRGDTWSLRTRGSRSVLPFLGGGGLHPGESERDRLDTRLGMRLSPRMDVDLGFDVLATRGDVRGTLLDGGSIIPVVGSQDRTSREAWGSVNLHGDTWHLGLRQAWLDEDGDDDRDRRRPALPGRDSLVWRDNSDMSGPVTSVTAGADVMDGRLSVELRGSAARLDRDVDIVERRSGFVGVSPFTRTTASSGDRDRDVDMLSLEASLEVSECWAVEASTERRTLSEDGGLRITETVDPGTGPVTTTTRESDRVRQALLTHTLGARWAPMDELAVRFGAEQWTDERDETGLPDETITTRGVYAGLEGRLNRQLRGGLSARTTDSRGAFTALTPEDRADLAAHLSWRDDEARRARMSWRRTQAEADDSGLGSEGDSVSASFGLGDEDGWTADLGATWHRIDLSVDNLAFRGTGFRAGRSRAGVASTTLDLRLGAPLSDRVRGEFTLVHTRDRGDLPVRGLDAVLGLRWEVEPGVVAGIRVRRRVYDEVGEDTLDYNARILEVWLEFGF